MGVASRRTEGVERRGMGGDRRREGKRGWKEGMRVWKVGRNKWRVDKDVVKKHFLVKRKVQRLGNLRRRCCVQGCRESELISACG